MSTKTRQIKVWLPRSLYEGLLALVASVSGLNASVVVRGGLEEWLQEAEREEVLLRDFTGHAIRKAAGEPYPPRTKEIERGRPMGSSDAEEELASLTFRVTPEYSERIHDVLYWRNEYLSHVVRDVIERAIARYQQ